MIKTIIFIYLLLGILSRVIFFIVQNAVSKKYEGFHKYEGGSFTFELFAHALDVIAWPFATYVSFTLLHKEIERLKNSD